MMSSLRNPLHVADSKNPYSTHIPGSGSVVFYFWQQGSPYKSELAPVGSLSLPACRCSVVCVSDELQSGLQLCALSCRTESLSYRTESSYRTKAKCAALEYTSSVKQADRDL